MFLNHAPDGLVRFALAAQGFNFIADHSDESLNRKHLTTKTSRSRSAFCALPRTTKQVQQLVDYGKLPIGAYA